MHGVPACIRSDKGPEFVCQAIQRRPASLDARTLHVESSQSRLRDELLSLEQFDSARPPGRIPWAATRTRAGIGRTDPWTASPPTSSRVGVLTIRSISTPTHYL